MPDIKLSLAAYSFRDYLPHGDKKGKMTLFDLMEMVAAWQLDGIELTSYYFTSEDNAYLHALKAKAFKLGLDVSGTAVGNNFCQPSAEARAAQVADVKKWVDHAVELGAPCLRVFAGSKPSQGTREDTFKWVVECVKECCDYAGGRGVFVALENHGYLTETAPDILKIVEAVNHEWLGINLDTGNFVAAPYDNMAQVAAKTITCHIKGELRTTDGKGEEEADFNRIVRILRDVNYRGYISLEYESKEDAMTGVPKCLDKMRKAVTS